MFSITTNFINVNDDLFQVKRTIREDKIKIHDLDLLKAWLGVDVVFKKDDTLYFCIKIDELEIVN